MTLKIAIVLPRNTVFSPRKATSVDLCVHDLVRHSRFAATTLVICDHVEQPFTDVAVTRIRYEKSAGNQRRIAEVTRALRAAPADLVIVHQHLPTAARLRRDISAPILLHTHNFLKFPKSLYGRLTRPGDYARLNGMVFVSQACRQAFENDYPANAVAKAVVENGLDMQAWRTDAPRRNSIVVVGRAMPEKGMLEAMQALAATLPAFTHWRASFILSESEKHRDYFAALGAIAAQSNGQIEILENLPYSEVQSMHEQAAIAMVLSKWREPFGRTALEAHAAGAALISSGTGGLREISGEHALYANPDEPKDISAALASLMKDDALRTRLAEGGRTRVTALFDVRTLTQKLDGFYNAMVAL